MILPKAELSISKLKSKIKQDDIIPAGAVAIALGIAEPLEIRDFDIMLQQFTMKFNKDFYKKNTLENKTAEQLFKKCIDRGVTRKEFYKMLDRYIYDCKDYGKIDLGEFFQYPRVELRSQAWMIKQKLSNDSFRCYDIDGVPMFTFEFETRLPFKLWGEK